MAKLQASRVQKNGINVHDNFMMDYIATFDEKATLCHAGTPSLEKYFALSGRKIGDSITMTIPSIFEASDGAVITDESLNMLNERTIVLTVHQINLPFQFSQEDLTLSIDEFNERVTIPAVNGMLRKFEQKAFACFDEIGNFVGNHDYKFTPSLLLQANELLEENGAVANKKYVFIPPKSVTEMVNEVSGNFNPVKTVSDMFTNGKVQSNISGFECVQSIHTKVHEFGSAVGVDTITVSVANQTGDTLAITGLTNELNVGDRFMLDGVKRLKANLDPSSEEQGFSVLSVSADKKTIKISPAIRTRASDGTQANVSKSPAKGDKLYFVGKAGEFATVNIAFVDKALRIVNVDQKNTIKENADMTVVTKEGYSFRYTKGYDIKNDETTYRLDAFVGMKVVHDKWAMVIFTNYKSNADSPIARAKKEAEGETGK